MPATGGPARSGSPSAGAASAGSSGTSSGGPPASVGCGAGLGSRRVFARRVVFFFAAIAGPPYCLAHSTRRYAEVHPFDSGHRVRVSPTTSVSPRPDYRSGGGLLALGTLFIVGRCDGRRGVGPFFRLVPAVKNGMPRETDLADRR